MKITIDTKEDSHEDIQKVMQILRHVVQNNNSKEIVAPIQSVEPVDTTNMMNMFEAEVNKQMESDQKQINEPIMQEQESAPDFTSLLKLSEEKKEENNEDNDNCGIQFF
jgi:hypothetical protein